MFDKTTIDQISSGIAYTVRGASLDQLRQLLRDTDGAPHLQPGDDAAIVLLDPYRQSGRVMDLVEVFLDASCDGVEQAIKAWRQAVDRKEAPARREAAAVALINELSQCQTEAISIALMYTRERVTR